MIRRIIGLIFHEREIQMTVTFSETLPPISESDIQALEGQLGARLPDSYRTFLLEHNGGKPSSDIFFISEREGTDSLRFLFGMADHEYYSLTDQIRGFSNWIPANFIPIGCDDFGNVICLSIKGEDVGKVYFWDQEYSVDEEGKPDNLNITLIGDSFSEFIDGLYDFSP